LAGLKERAHVRYVAAVWIPQLVLER
jgi:hypothetical protein